MFMCMYLRLSGRVQRNIFLRRRTYFFVLMVLIMLFRSILEVVRSAVLVVSSPV